MQDVLTWPPTQPPSALPLNYLGIELDLAKFQYWGETTPWGTFYRITSYANERGLFTMSNLNIQ